MEAEVDAEGGEGEEAGEGCDAVVGHLDAAPHREALQRREERQRLRRREVVGWGQAGSERQGVVLQQSPSGRRESSREP